jgi:cytochrome c553
MYRFPIRLSELNSLLTITMLLLTASLVSGSLAAAGNYQAGEAKAAACMACHGTNGNSENPAWPKLSQQHPGYFVKQVMDFQSGARQHEMMSPMAIIVSEQDAYDLARFFGTQKRIPGTTDENYLRFGKEIYTIGNRAHGVMGCYECHGEDGEGNDPNLFPMISGQHATYVEKILKEFRSGKRKNDRWQLMQKTVKGLTDEEIIAVAQYVQGLPHVPDDEPKFEAPADEYECPPFEDGFCLDPPTGSSFGGHHQIMRGPRYRP